MYYAVLNSEHDKSFVQVIQGKLLLKTA